MSQRKLKIMWCSNPAWTPSGYSQQTADMEKQFLKAGWDNTNLAMINMFGQNGGKFKDEFGVWNYPLINHPTGSDAMVFHSKHFQADVVFGLFDIHTQDVNALASMPRFIPWVPIDYDPIPPIMLQNLRPSNRIIAMSQFGQKSLLENGFASTYIPHHVDTSVFFPMDKRQAKIDRGINPDLFIFGMVAANKDALPRKSFGQVLEAFAKFVKKHPNSALYIHTNPDQMGGYPIKHHAGLLGLQNHIVFPDLYKWQFDTSKEEMNKIYNTFDCLLSPSSSEGFNIPVIEAQATGTPVIVNDWTSMPELIRENVTGYKTKVHCKHMMPIGSYMAFPDEDDLLQKMLRVKGMKIEEMGKAARKWIVDNYSMESLWQTKWQPFLDKLENEIYPQEQLTTPEKKA